MRLDIGTCVLPTARARAERGAGFGVPHLLTLLLLVVMLPVFLLGAAVALPVGAAVLSIDLARRAWLLRRDQR